LSTNLSGAAVDDGQLARRQFFLDQHQMVDLQSALRLAYPRDVLQEEDEEEEESCIASHLCLCRQLFLDQLQMVDPQRGL
jgi:hypothetical protein